MIHYPYLAHAQALDELTMINHHNQLLFAIGPRPANGPGAFPCPSCLQPPHFQAPPKGAPHDVAGDGDA